MDSASLAGRLHVTAMAVRQHLYALQQEKLVTAEERPRPAWPPGEVLASDTGRRPALSRCVRRAERGPHHSVQDAFGPDGMARLLDARVARQRADYRSRIDASAPLGKRVQQLARIRAEKATWPK